MTKNNWILVGGVGAVGILGALFAALYILLWAPPSQDDFKSALADAEKISDNQPPAQLAQYNRLTVTLGNDGKSYEQIVAGVKEQREKTEKSLNARSDGAEKISDSKVVRDEEVKKVYDTYAAKEAKFQTYSRGYLEAFPLFKSAGSTCDDVFRVTRETTDSKKYAELHEEASKDCLSDLNKLAAVKGIAPLSDYGKEFARIVNARQTVFDELASGKKTEDQTLDSLQQLSKDVSANEPAPKLNALVKEVSFNGELTKLIDVLKKKSEQK